LETLRKGSAAGITHQCDQHSYDILADTLKEGWICAD
jgi:hypothetical protein